MKMAVKKNPATWPDFAEVIHLTLRTPFYQLSCRPGD